MFSALPLATWAYLKLLSGIPSDIDICFQSHGQLARLKDAYDIRIVQAPDPRNTKKNADDGLWWHGNFQVSTFDAQITSSERAESRNSQHMVHDELSNLGKVRFGAHF